MVDCFNMDFFINEYQKEIVGESNTIKFLVLVMASRWVKNKKPISFHTLINSESGAGKDFILQTIFKVLEPEFYCGFTRISGRALDYLKPIQIYKNNKDNSWDDMFLGLEDIESDILNSSTLKVFLSNGSKTAIVFEGRVSTTNNIGCPVILMTSAYSDPNKELMRRINILNLDESDEQTQRILLNQSKIKESSVDYNILRKCIKSFKCYDVRIDFCKCLASKISHIGTHMRTFFPRFLDFIKASTVLHQNCRVIENGRIYAQEEDYNIVKELFENLSITASFNPLSRRKKEILNILIYEFDGGWFSIPEACKVLNFTYQGAFKHIKQFIEDDLLEFKTERDEFSNKPTYFYKPKIHKKLQLPLFKELVDDE